MRLLTRAPPLVAVLSLSAALAACAAPGMTKRAPRPTFSYTHYAALLQSSVDPAGHVAYERLKSDPQLAASLADFAAASPASAPTLFPTRADSLAYWINAYNLFVLAGVARSWPARSVREEGTDVFFTRVEHDAGGRLYSLNELEGAVIRKGFGEPRIHFTINCGATSCPILKPAPFTGADLETRLDTAARLFINDPGNVRVDSTAGVLWLSSIFDWYHADFLASPPAAVPGGAPSLQAYVAYYLADPATARRLRGPALPVQYLEYDWSLNADVLPVR